MEVAAVRRPYVRCPRNELPSRYAFAWSHIHLAHVAENNITIDPVVSQPKREPAVRRTERPWTVRSHHLASGSREEPSAAGHRDIESVVKASLFRAQWRRRIVGGPCAAEVDHLAVLAGVPPGEVEVLVCNPEPPSLFAPLGVGRACLLGRRGSEVVTERRVLDGLDGAVDTRRKTPCQSGLRCARCARGQKYHARAQEGDVRIPPAQPPPRRCQHLHVSIRRATVAIPLREC